MPEVNSVYFKFCYCEYPEIFRVNLTPLNRQLYCKWVFYFWFFKNHHYNFSFSLSESLPKGSLPKSPCLCQDVVRMKGSTPGKKDGVKPHEENSLLPVQQENWLADLMMGTWLTLRKDLCQVESLCWYDKCEFWIEMNVHTENYGRTRQAAGNNILRRLRVTCWINKAMDAHSEYVIFIPFLLQQ